MLKLYLVVICVCAHVRAHTAKLCIAFSWKNYIPTQNGLEKFVNIVEKIGQNA